MNTKGIKFLAVLAVLAMAFAVFAVSTEESDADAVSYYVSSEGSDDNPGTQALPFATVRQAIVTAEANQATIYLLSDISETKGIDIGTVAAGGSAVATGYAANVTIDLGGHTWKLTNTVGSTTTVNQLIRVLKDSTVTIKDGTVSSVATSESKLDILTMFHNYGTSKIDSVTFDTGVFDNSSTVSERNQVILNETNTLTITGQTNILDTRESTDKTLWAVVSNSYGNAYTGGKVTIDEKFIGTIEGGLALTFEGDAPGAGETYGLEIKAGTFKNTQFYTGVWFTSPTNWAPIEINGNVTLTGKTIVHQATMVDIVSGKLTNNGTMQIGSYLGVISQNLVEISSGAVLENNGSIKVYGFLQDLNRTGTVGTKGIAGNGSITVPLLGSLSLGYVSHQKLVSNEIVVEAGGFLAVGSQNLLVGAVGGVEGLFNLDMSEETSKVKVKVNENNGADVTFYGKVSTANTGIENFMGEDDTVVVASGTLTLNDDITIPEETSVELKKGATITLATEKTITGEVFFGEDSAVFDGFGIASSANTSGTVTITTGSIMINGEAVSGSITVDGTVEISGTAGSDLDITLTDGAVLMVPAGKELDITNVSIILGDDDEASFIIAGTLSGTSSLDADELEGLTVAASDPEAVKDKLGDDFEVEAYGSITVDTEAELIAALDEGFTEIIMGLSFEITDDLEMPSTLTLDLAGYTLTIASEKELTLKGTKVIDSSENTSGLIVVLGFLTLESADVCANVTPYDQTTFVEKGYITVTGAKTMTVTGTLNSNLAVGYGNKLIITDLTVPSGKKVSVFGTMTAEGSLTIASGGLVVVNTYASAEINATTNVEGAFVNNGLTTINGNLTVYKAAGGAQFDNNGMLYISLTSNFNVTAGRQSDATANVFNAGGAYLYGTATITGTMNGTLIDYGDLTFNGTAGTDAIIEARNGVTIAVLSVTGILGITDDDAAKDDTWDYTEKAYKEYVRVYDGNIFTLKNVKGLTITQTTVVTPKVDSTTGKTIKYYASTLTLSGVSSSVTKDVKHSIDVNGGVKKTAWTTTVSTGSANIGDLTIGKDGTITFRGNEKTVSGTLQAIAKSSKIAFSDDETNTTVLGTIYTNDKNESSGFEKYAGNVDAAYFVITDEEGSVHQYLTTFEAALSVVATVDDMAIMLYGTQELGTTASYEIPAYATITLYEDCELTIKGDLKVIKNGTLNGSAAMIDVQGLLTIEDKNTGLKYNTATDMFKYQVFTENGDTVKYSGITRAIADSSFGDVITMVQDGKISKSVTIPAGVTVIVPNGIELEIGSTSSKITLTVDGFLQMKRTGNVVLADKAKEVTLKINGAIIDDDATPSFTIGDFSATGYVIFNTKIDGRPNTVYSNIEYAALVVSEGNVTVIGSVSASEVTFTTTGDSEIVIVVDETDDDDLQNVLAVGTLTLVDAKLTVNAASTEDNPGVFSGVVVALSDDDEAAITMANATGFAVESVVTEVAAGYEYAMYFTAGTNQGLFIISEGTVFACEGDISTPSGGIIIGNALGETKASLTIDEDAKLVIPDDGLLVYMASSSVDDEYVISNMLTIDGTLVAEEGSVVELVGVDVNGVFNVQTDKAGVANAYINGTVLVTENKAGNSLLTIFGLAYVWDDSSATGSAATLAGAIKIYDESGVLMVYPGADISEAQINWNKATGQSDAVYTDYYINEELYMTAFASQSMNVLALLPIYAEDYDLIGLDCGTRIYDDDPTVGSGKSSGLYKYTNWYSDTSMADNAKMGASAKIGQYEAFYAIADVATVQGTITVGVGLTLYVDGVGFTASDSDKYDLGVGTHTLYVELQSGYVGDKVTIKFNDAPVSAGKITITPDMTDFTLVTTGAEPYTPEPTPEPEKESEWTVTTILLCVLVVLIAIMAVIVALRLNRN